MGNYKNFELVVYFVAGGVTSAEEKKLESDIAFFKKYMRLDKVYIEPMRGESFASEEQLRLCKEVFERNGIRTSGGITTCLPDKEGEKKKQRLFSVLCYNDHVPSPDNKMLAVSCSEPGADGSHSSHIFVIPMEGGEAKRISRNSPSYLHGWSFDGKEFAYCAFRNGKINIYTISSEGGEETCITDGIGYNDGPEYSPDDKHIWFNSSRTGLMQIYRIDRDGSNLTQVTDAESNSWFAHVSPNGEKVVWLIFRKGDLHPDEHLPDKDVELWLMNYDGSDKKCIVSLFGGQGTINVNSWSPDSRRFAFVSYRYE